MEQQQCPICILPLTENAIATLPCNHQLCCTCIVEYTQYSNKCPICVKEFLNYKSSPEDNVHLLSQSDLNVIQDQKKKLTQEENFECITREEVRKQMKDLRYMANQISTNLFSCRSTEEGSDKERGLLESVFDDLVYIDELLEVEEFEGKTIMNNLNAVIVNIKDLKSRKYKEYIEKNDSNEGINVYYSIQYVNNPQGKKKKKKRK